MQIPVGSDVNYSSMTNESNPFIQHKSASDDELATDTDNDGRDGLMIHVVPDTSKCKANDA